MRISDWSSDVCSSDLFTSSYAVAMGCLFFGFAILTCAYGPIYALVQNVMRPDMRAFAISLTLLATNLIGAGLGPLLIGFASDVAAAEGESNPLRIGVLVGMAFFPLDRKRTRLNSSH